MNKSNKKQLKKVKSNTLNLGPTRERNITYNRLICWREIPISETRLDQLAEEMVNWVDDNPDAMAITQFLNLYKMSYESFYKFIDRNENMKLAHKYTLMTLGMHRELRALNNEINPNIASFMMPYYDQNWKAIAEWRAKLNNKNEDKKDQKITVEVVAVPNCSSVPEKPKDE